MPCGKRICRKHILAVIQILRFPYEEIGEITAVCADGRRIPVIQDGRFVLAGTEELNKPFDEK